MGAITLPVVEGLFDETDDFLCARCARRQKTCCQRTDIVVTDGDMARIAAHLGHQDFVEFRAAGGPEYLDQDDDPLWRDATFYADGQRRLVKQRPDGDCTFLGPMGCTLPADVRPLICRLFPFDYDERGLFAAPASGCPVHLLADGESLFDALRMNRSDAEQWHRQLYAELRETLAHRGQSGFVSNDASGGPPFLETSSVSRGEREP
jgi:Fe-S-cluster containining protein